MKLSLKQENDLKRLFYIADKTKAFQKGIENKCVWFNIDKDAFYIAHKNAFIGKKEFFMAGDIDTFKKFLLEKENQCAQ